MNQLTQIEKIYQIWDGTPNHAQVCMRYIHLIMENTDTSLIKEIIDENEPFIE